MAIDHAPTGSPTAVREFSRLFTSANRFDFVRRSGAALQARTDGGAGTADGVADWLRRLGLEQYAPVFAANDVDGEILPELTPHDLLGLGITSIGHRRKLLAAIAAFRSDARSPPRRPRPFLRP